MPWLIQAVLTRRYSFAYGSATFVVASSEHDLQHGSPQHAWLEATLAAVDRCTTPWLLLALHRPLYVVHPHKDNRVVGQHLRDAIESLLDRWVASLSGDVCRHGTNHLPMSLSASAGHLLLVCGALASLHRGAAPARR